MTSERFNDHRQIEGAGVSGEKEGKHGVQSLEIGMHILQAILNGHRSMMLKEIAAVVGMPTSKVHRYLVSMIRTGLVEQEMNGSRYDLGPFALNVGLVAMDRLDRVKAGLDVTVELCAEVGEVTALATWTENGPIVVRWERPPNPVSISVITGTSLNMLTTVSGRIFGAYLPPEKYDHLIESELKSPDLPEELRSRAQVENLFAEIRKAGVAVIDSDHLLKGVAAVSAPVFNSANEITLGISVVGFQGILDTRLDGKIVSTLKASALKLSKKLGYHNGV